MSRLVIGVGNRLRGDDAAGIEVARRVVGCRTVESVDGGFELIDMWTGADDVVVVDATRSGQPPGAISRFDPSTTPVLAGTFASSHAIGVAETIEMARSLGSLPKRISVYGIEAGDVSIGRPMSPEVLAAVERVAREISDA